MTAPVVRCHNTFCRTTVDLDDDPAALMSCCGAVICDGCPEHVCEAGR